MSLSYGELLDVYRATPQTLRALVQGVDEERARERPDEDSWSIVEVVAHLADAEANAYERVRRMLAEDNPTFEGYDEQEWARARNYRAMHFGTALRRFEEHRAAQIGLLEQLDSDGWERPARHNQLGAITVSSITAHMTAHDAIHLAQIARIRLNESGA